MQTRETRLETWRRDLLDLIEKGLKFYENDRLHKARNAFNDALKYIDVCFDLVSKDKDTYLFHRQSAMACYQEEDKLRELYAAVVALRGVTYFARYQRNLSEQGLEKSYLHDCAVTDLKDATRANFNNPEIALYRAELYLADKNYPKALYYYCRATWLDPDLAQEEKGDFYDLLYNNDPVQIIKWIAQLSRFNQSFVVSMAESRQHCLGRRMIAPTPPPIPPKEVLAAALANVEGNLFFKSAKSHETVSFTKNAGKGKDRETTSAQSQDVVKSRSSR